MTLVGAGAEGVGGAVGVMPSVAVADAADLVPAVACEAGADGVRLHATKNSANSNDAASRMCWNGVRRWAVLRPVQSTRILAYAWLAYTWAEGQRWRTTQPGQFGLRAKQTRRP